MLLLMTIDGVTNINDAEYKVLAGWSAKDKIVVFAYKEAMMSIEMYQKLSSLKCQLEIEYFEERMYFELGYNVGRIASTVKNGEKVFICIGNKFDTKDKNVVWIDNITDIKNGKSAASKESKTGSRAGAKSEVKVATKPETKAAVKAETKIEAKTKPETKPVEKSEKKPVEKAVKKSVKESLEKVASSKKSANIKGTALWAILGKYSKMKPYKDFVIKNEEALRGAILSATDSEITFKFQLQINFGSDGVAIWEILYKNFDDIKMQVASMV